MELYEEVEEKKSKIPKIIGICIVVLVILTSLIIYAIIYLKNSIKLVKIDGQRNTQIEELLYIEETEQGIDLYIPIVEVSQYLGYSGYIGDYKEKSEDKTKCHVTNANETAMFSKDSDMLIKITKDSEYQYVQIDKQVFEKDGKLYTTIDGIEKAFNIVFFTDENFKNINIYSMDYLLEFYATNLKLEKYSDNFTDKKAILENMIIIEEGEKYGVINAENGDFILQAKYQEIEYLPTIKSFLVKSNGKYGIMSKDASTTIKITYDKIKPIDNQHGLYLVKYNNVYGIMNSEGETVIEAEYKQIGLNIDKYKQNGVENAYVLMDEVIPVQNTDGVWALFNIKGEMITDFKYTNIGCQSSPIENTYPVLVVPSYKVIVVAKGKYYNLVTTTGEELVSGDILDTVYLKSNASTEQTQFFMTSNDNTKVINIEEWLTSIGR